MELHPAGECLAGPVTLQCLCLISERWPKLESDSHQPGRRAVTRHNMECGLSSRSSADFNSDLFCTRENAKCNCYCQVTIGAWRAFLGIKGLGLDLQGSVGEPGRLKQDDLPQAPPRSDGGGCLRSSADQRETGLFEWRGTILVKDAILMLSLIGYIGKEF